MPSPPAARRIVLVGFMGAGKSTVGPLLAGRLGWDFLDLDRQIEEKTGMSVAALFRDRGAGAFRDEERAAAVQALTRERLVIAAGGGAFTQPETRRILQEEAQTVWLRCDPLVLFARIPADGTRPLAENRDIMMSLLAERESSYRLADCTVDTTTATPDQVARRIMEALFEREP